MGLFGGMFNRSSSQSSSTTNNYFDDRDVLDYSGQSGVVGNGNIVMNTTTDAGASQNARDIAVTAITAAQETSRQAVGAMADSTSRAFDSADHFIDTTRSAYGDALGFADRNATMAVGATEKALTVSLGAVQAAKDSATGDRTLMYVALAVVGVVGVAVAFRKG